MVGSNTSMYRKYENSPYLHSFQGKKSENSGSNTSTLSVHFCPQSSPRIMEKCDTNIAKYLVKKERLRNTKSKEKMVNLSDDLGIKPVFGNIQRNPFPNILSHECEICQSRFVTEPLLKEHLRNFHKKNDKSFECTICNSSFKKKPDLAIHEKIRHKEN